MSRYPSEVELKAIADWDYKDIWGLVDFVNSIWSDYGRAEVVNARDTFGEHCRKWRLITGGWSGNEDIIGALNKNVMFNMLYWYMDMRGGLHEYKIKAPWVRKKTERKPKAPDPNQVKLEVNDL